MNSYTFEHDWALEVGERSAVVQKRLWAMGISVTA